MDYLVSIADDKLRAHREFGRLTSFGENVLEERYEIGSDIFKERYNAYIGRGDERYYWGCSKGVLGEVIGKLTEGLEVNVEVRVKRSDLSNLPDNLRDVVEGFGDWLKKLPNK